MKNKNNLIAGFLVFLTIIICLFIFPPFIKLLAETKAFHPIFQIITEDNYEAWIGYYGAILGGALTLVGVWWTIKSEDKQKRDDKINSQRPFLKITLHNKANDDYYSVVPAKVKMFISYFTKEDEDRCVIPAYKVSLKLENIGLGIAENIYFETISYEFYRINDNNTKTTYSYNIAFENLYDFPYIQNNNYEIIPILFRYNESNKSKNYAELIKPFQKCLLHYEGNIHFYDCFNNHFIQKMILEADVSHYTTNNTLSFKATKLYLENIKPIDSINNKKQLNKKEN